MAQRLFNKDGLIKDVPGIYSITSPSNKVYIGQSWNVLSRLYGHRHSAKVRCSKLYSSIKKYGFDNHNIDVLQEFPLDISQSALDSYEKFYISQLICANISLLNLTDGGMGGRPSEEVRAKISLKLIGRKCGRGRKGVPQTEETRNKIRLSKIGKNTHSDIEIEKRRQRMIGNSNTRGWSASVLNKKVSRSRQIIQYSLDGEKIREWISIRHASEVTGILRTSINNNLKGWSNRAGKFKWEYKNI